MREGEAIDGGEAADGVETLWVGDGPQPLDVDTVGLRALLELTHDKGPRDSVRESLEVGINKEFGIEVRLEGPVLGLEFSGEVGGVGTIEAMAGALASSTSTSLSCWSMIHEGGVYGVPG